MTYFIRNGLLSDCSIIGSNCSIREYNFFCEVAQEFCPLYTIICGRSLSLPLKLTSYVVMALLEFIKLKMIDTVSIGEVAMQPPP